MVVSLMLSAARAEHTSDASVARMCALPLATRAIDVLPQGIEASAVSNQLLTG